eukprot:COSAG01_NODE_7065_length_3369_cov_10.052905_3_plen_77_part_00
MAGAVAMICVNTEDALGKLVSTAVQLLLFFDRWGGGMPAQMPYHAYTPSKKKTAWECKLTSGPASASRRCAVVSLR